MLKGLALSPFGVPVVLFALLVVGGVGVGSAAMICLPALVLGALIAVWRGIKGRKAR
jgi:hypothetical protein